MDLIRKFNHHLKTRGLSNTIKEVFRTIRIKLSLFRDVEFDIKYGTDTRTWVKLETLNILSENKENGTEYQATREKAFKKLMDKIKMPRTENVFVDFGSGKGRVLLMATSYPFKRTVGIEFSNELCAIARRNVEIYRSKTNIASLIEIIESDVLAYQFNDDENFFYLANPFNGVILKKLLDKIKGSLTRNPRRIFLIYNNPVFNEILVKCDFLQQIEEYHFSDSSVFLIYTNISLI